MDQPYVIIAEDEAIIGIDLCETLAEAGFEVEGPLPDLASAMLASQLRKPDAAILDINLGDENSFALAEKLLADDVKVIFHSGAWSPEDVQRHFPKALLLQKPCPPMKMVEALQTTLEPA